MLHLNLLKDWFFFTFILMILSVKAALALSKSCLFVCEIRLFYARLIPVSVYVFRFLSSQLSLLINRNINVLFMGLPQSLCQQSTFRVFESSERKDSSNLSVTVSKDIGIND